MWSIQLSLCCVSLHPSVCTCSRTSLAIPAEELVTSPMLVKANRKGFKEPEPSQVCPHDLVDPFSTSLHNLGSNSNGIEVPVELNGTLHLMELDTGAGVSRNCNLSHFERDVHKAFQEHTPPSIQNSPTHLHRKLSQGICSIDVRLTKNRV